MGELSINSIKKNSILLSRNIPVALVVGAAGFLGSHLVEKLLSKNIQVVGVDDFSTGEKEFLSDASKDKNFHFINGLAQSVDLNVPRLDYVFITAGEGWSLSKILNLTKKYSAKLVFISFINLYDKEFDSDLKWFKASESDIASSAAENRLNARIIRLAGVYGPRMNFKIDDPIIRLVHASLNNNLQKEGAVMEFSTRGLYIDDAVELIIKSMLSGSTAQKIFDGSRLIPIKVAEIRQVLMDPVWYENRGFIPADLPPWPTPNLEKTIKTLSWEPKVDLVKSLSKTLAYFREHKVPDKLPLRQEKLYQTEETEERKKQLAAMKEDFLQKDDKKVEKIQQKGESKTEKSSFKFFSAGTIYTVIALAVIFYGLVWPIIAVTYQFYDFRSRLVVASNQLSKGEFDQSIENIKQAKKEVGEMKKFLEAFSFAQNYGPVGEYLATAQRLVDMSADLVSASEHVAIGTKSLYQGFKSVTGEITNSPEEFFSIAQGEFAKSDEILSKTKAEIERDNIESALPDFLKGSFESLKTKLVEYGELVKKGRTISAILPSVTALEGKKSYLILFQNNNELRPTGGFIGSYGRIDFAGGKLKKLEVNDIYSLDGQLAYHVEPPKEIKEGLNQKDWYLRDSNWEPDFPTSARQAEWFYTKESGQRVDGTIALDLSAIEDLLRIMGPLDLADYNETITGDNLFEKSVTHAEKGFFPGSQSKKNFLTALTYQLFNKLFFLPNQNWPGIVSSLGKSLEQKHLMVYLDDPKLFSYMVSQNWAGALPRPGNIQEGELDDFLAVVEANLGGNKSNYYLDRNYQLNTTIGKEDDLSHRLKINYINRSPSDVWPAGIYKDSLRIYLPFGAKLTRVLWGQEDITKSMKAFADYGRSGYGVTIILSPKESRSLVIDYQLSGRLSFKEDTAVYRMNVLKQAGLLNDPFEWKLSYPISYKVISSEGKDQGPQEHSISTDLSHDRLFEVTFKK